MGAEPGPLSVTPDPGHIPFVVVFGPLTFSCPPTPSWTRDHQEEDTCLWDDLDMGSSRAPVLVPQGATETLDWMWPSLTPVPGKDRSETLCHITVVRVSSQGPGPGSVQVEERVRQVHGHLRARRGG